MSYWTVFEILVNIYQGFLWVYFLKNRLRQTRRNVVADISCVALSGGFLSLYLFFDIPILDTVTFLFPLTYSLFQFDDKWYIKLFWNVILAALFIGTSVGMLAIYTTLLNISVETIASESTSRFIYVIVSNTALTAVTFAVSKFKFGQEKPSLSAVAILFIQILINLVAMELAFEIRISIPETDSTLVLLCICLFASSLISLILYETMSKYAGVQARQSLELETLRLKQLHTDELRNMYTDILAYRHDMKHQMEIIDRMIADKNVSAGKAYFDSLRRKEADTPEFMTGNVAVDALLSVKAHKIREQGISFQFSPYPLNELPIQEYDFCAILGNILDNAIEGASKLPKDAPSRAISLKFSCAWDMFYINCDNDALASEVRVANHGFISTKKELMHGYGIRNINSIVDRAEGHCSFSLEDDTFRVSIALPFSVR